jgi:hypothetical protein
MKWSCIRKISEQTVIDKIEEENGIVFPKDYISLVNLYNAGIPEYCNFSDRKGHSYVFDRLISVNQKDSPNIDTAISWIEQVDSLSIPIALDAVGNMICLEYCAGICRSIILINFESEEKETLSDSLTDFLLKLH